jgi:hypothetical protein
MALLAEFAGFAELAGFKQPKIKTAYQKYIQAKLNRSFF